METNGIHRKQSGDANGGGNQDIPHINPVASPVKAATPAAGPNREWMRKTPKAAGQRYARGDLLPHKAQQLQL
jgi:hypothetical protein